MKHLDLPEILAYVAEQVSEEAGFEVETHLAVCPECARKVRAHFYIRDHFDELWSKWTAREHAASLARVESAVAGRPAVLKVPVPGAQRHLLIWLAPSQRRFRKRLAALFGSIPQRIEAAMKVVIDAGRKKVGILEEGLEDYVRKGRPYGFLPVSPFGQPAVLGDAGEFEGPALSVKADGYPPIEITANAEDRTVSVLVTVKEAEVREGEWPLAVLVPAAGGEARVAELKPVKESLSRGRVSLLAEFDEIEGEHLLFVEAGT